MKPSLKLCWMAVASFFLLAEVACPRNAPPKGKRLNASWSGSLPKTSKAQKGGKPGHRFPKVGKYQLIDDETPGTGALQIGRAHV
mgnify:FL=1